jgi:predicted  nucleic acid-binding Zn-ribbon protein
VSAGAGRACDERLTSQEHNRVMKASVVVTCRSCAQVLYAEE